MNLKIDWGHERERGRTRMDRQRRSDWAPKGGRDRRSIERCFAGGGTERKMQL